MKTSPLPVYLYGLYKGNICIYVGVTGNPTNRLQSHIYNKRIGKHFPFEMKVFRALKKSSAHRLEYQVVRAMRRRGMAHLNRRICQQVKCHRAITLLPETAIILEREAKRKGITFAQQIDFLVGVGHLSENTA